MKKLRIVLLPVILASIIALFSMTGCATGATTPAGTTPIAAAPQEELSQQQLQQVLSDCLVNQESLNTYKYDLDMDMIMTISGGAQSGKMTVTTKSSGAIKPVSHEMQATMEMTMNAEGVAGYEDSSQTITYDAYQMADWVYMRMEVPGMGEQWMKMPVTEDLAVKLNLVDQQLGPLESVIKIELKGYTSVDGEECYVLSLVPDMAELTQWVSEQQGATQDIDWGEISNLSDVFKKLEYTCYIAKDSKLLKKLTINMQMNFAPEQMGISEDADSVTMNISIDMTLSDHNVPFTINLPEEAENAMEVSPDMFQ